MVNETAIFIKDKIARLEREQTQAIARAKDYRLKSEEMTRRADEYKVLLRYLRQWEATEFGGGEITNGETNPVVTQTMGTLLTNFVPIRQLVTTCLQNLNAFTTNELVVAVQSLDPNAKGSSVQGDLSRRKANGEVVQVGPGLYRSCLFQSATKEEPIMPLPVTPVDNDFAEGEDPFADDEEDGLTDPFAEDDKGNNNEPGPSFGTIR